MSQLRLSGTMIEDADESIKDDIDRFEESGTNRSLADQSQHQIVEMLDKALSGEDPLSEVSESDGDCLDGETTSLSLSTSRHSSSDRRTSYRRKSSFGGEIRSNMFASIRKHRMDPEQLAILLRKYYEQDKELRRLEADLETVSLPIDFDQLSLQEATDQLLRMMEEVATLQDEVPDKSARNHEADLDHVLLILHNEYNKVESLTTAGATGGDSALPQTEEQKALVASARRIREKIGEMESLKQELRDKLEEVRILSQLPSPTH